MAGGFAKTTDNFCPKNSTDSISVIARKQDPLSLNSIKAKPRGSPVCGCLTILHLTISPNCSNNFLRTSSVMQAETLLTKRVVTFSIASLLISRDSAAAHDTVNGFP